MLAVIILGLAGWLTGDGHGLAPVRLCSLPTDRMEQPDYGKLIVCEFSKGQQVTGRCT